MSEHENDVVLRICTTDDMAMTHVKNNKQPFLCPVCLGSQVVTNGFYGQTSGVWSTASTDNEQCRTCAGTGIVWG